MKIESVKKILDVCQEAAHIQNLLPALPPGITPRCMRVIEQIEKLTVENGSVRVSEISEMLDVTRPGITVVLRDLTEKGYVEKDKTKSDGRVVYVSLTEKGHALYSKYVENYHSHLTDVLGELGDEGADTLEHMIHRIIALIDSDTKQQLSLDAKTS